MTIDNLILRIADWESDKKSLQSIRRDVFITEQNVPEAMEWDEFDKISTHFISTLNNQVVATARLMPDGKLGRMAVIKNLRNNGIGHQLLQFILQYAADKNFNKLYLHAQVNAIPFYEKQGFIICSDVFHEANIPHREMTKHII